MNKKALIICLILTAITLLVTSGCHKITKQDSPPKQDTLQNFDEFEKLIAENTSNNNLVFLIKAHISDGEEQESLWIILDEQYDYTYHGRLQHNPTKITTLKAGDLVVINESDFVDWAVLDIAKNEFIAGGYTITI